MLIVIVVLALKYLVLPNIENYQADIISRVAEASGMEVSATAIRGGWSGFKPYVELENVVFRETAATRAKKPTLAEPYAFRLPRFHASLSWWSLAIGQLRFADVSLWGPELSISRKKDGLIYFAGRALNAPSATPEDGRLLDWLLAQSGLDIQRATLLWEDELSANPLLKFTDVGIRLEKRLTGHVLGMVATPPAALAREIEVRGNVKITKRDDHWSVVGRVFAATNDANVAELQSHLPVSSELQTGLGNVRVWFDIDSTAALPTVANAAMVAFNPVRAITADINLVNARAQLAPDASTLNIARLAGRIEYQALAGGFTVGSTALALRTREGVILPPADFSLSMQNQSDPIAAKGEITASGIDLKVVAALLQYFPVGRDFRAMVARFNPRGVVKQSRFGWNGYLDNPTSFRVKGAMTDFAISADGSQPGIAGFSGTVEGDDKGGRFTIAAKAMQLDLPEKLRLPLKFDTFESNGAWQVTPAAIEIDLGRVAFANADVEGEFAGRYSRFRADGPRAKEEKGPGTLEIKGRLTRAKAVSIANYLPNAAAPTRGYLDFAVRDGDIVGADFSLKGEIFEFPFHNAKGGSFRIAAKVKDLNFRYLEDWPTAENINGELIFENTAFTAKIDAARFFNARVKTTTITVDDFAARPYLLGIKGQSEARGEDMARFIAASPLIDGVGAFTKQVALEGPGFLDLNMQIPLRPPEGTRGVTKISGRYSLQRGQAKLAFGPVISGLSGSVAFTEASVKSSGLVGTAYGNPISVFIANAKDGVVTDFVARADVAALTDVLPFAMPQQVTGTADFAGRIRSHESGIDIYIESPLLGVTSTLPAPLSKRRDEPRRLRLNFANTGSANETIRLTMAGNVAAAGLSNDTPESRIDARFQRKFDVKRNLFGFAGGIANVGLPLGEGAVPEGLWFGGTMPMLDFDRWKSAFDSFYPPAAAADAVVAKDIDIAGFDFNLGGLIAYGRPFDTMVLKGRHGGEDWRLTVDSAEVVGDITWRAGAFNDRGAVRARLQKLVLADEVPQPKGATREAVDADADSRLPALDIVAEKFTLKDRFLGKLELRATPMSDAWRIDQLAITTGHASLAMDGLWQRATGPEGKAKSQTSMNVHVESSNLNALFSQFGYGDQLKRGTGKLDGKLSWPGHVYQFQTAALSGQFKVDARNGQFAQIKVGAGKLLALISLQSIPRRFSFDFRDVFSEGFAFERIEGNIKINNGVMSTDDFAIVGTAANVAMSGDISLPAEHANLKLIVVPSLGEGVGIGIGVVLGPAVGLGALVLQKILQGALSYEYTVTGPWDDLTTEQIKNAPPPTKVGRTAAPTEGTTKKTP